MQFEVERPNLTRVLDDKSLALLELYDIQLLGEEDIGCRGPWDDNILSIRRSGGRFTVTIEHEAPEAHAVLLNETWLNEEWCHPFLVSVAVARLARGAPPLKVWLYRKKDLEGIDLYRYLKNFNPSYVRIKVNDEKWREKFDNYEYIIPVKTFAKLEATPEKLFQYIEKKGRKIAIRSKGMAEFTLTLQDSNDGEEPFDLNHSSVALEARRANRRKLRFASAELNAAILGRKGRRGCVRD